MVSAQQSLREIDRKILQKQQSGLVYRFFIDAEQKIYLHLWQRLEFEKDQECSFGVEKFQLSNENWAFEWKKNSSLKCAQISEKNIPHKPKASPLMIMQSEKNDEAYDYFKHYLEENSMEAPSRAEFPERDIQRFLIFLIL